MLNQRILKKFGDSPIDSVKMERLDQTTQVTNESLDTIMKRLSAKTGYKEFSMGGWRGLEKPLEETLLERLTELLVNVENFIVAGMLKLPPAVIDQLSQFAATVLE